MMDKTYVENFDMRMKTNKQFYNHGKLIVKAIQRNEVVKKIAEIDQKMNEILSKIGKAKA